MTKSVKEKERLAKIRECQFNDIPIPAELLKVKILEIKLSRNFCKRNKTVHNYDFFVKKFKLNFKQYVNKYIVYIANQMQIYEFKIRIMPYFYDAKIPTQDNLPCITLFIKDFKNRYFGYLIMSEHIKLNKYDTYDGYNFFPCVFSNELKTLDQKSQEDMSMLYCKIQFEESFFARKISVYKNRKFYDDISKLMITKNKFLQDIGMPFSESKPLKLFFHISKEINISWIANNKRYETYSIKNITEIDILKVFIGLGCIEINIPEEELIMKNIETIKNMIRLSNY